MPENLPLVNILQQLAQRNESPFYAPGHKKGKGISTKLIELLGEQVFRADLPELPELDNLFAPESVIKKAQDLAAATFKAQQSWFLVNGSSCGLIAAILATCKPGDKIVLPRNSHQSVFSGLILSGAMPVFLEPEYDSYWDLSYCFTPAALALALQEHPDARAVLVTYPTYQGVTGNLGEIEKITHLRKIPLIVDQAHGAHFAFHGELPDCALSLGADLVIQSTHKVLGSLTQSSMLHLQGNIVDPDRINRSLQLVQSTSASYLLLASLDAATAQMAQEGYSLLERTLNLAKSARAQLKSIEQLVILEQPLEPREGFQSLDLTRLSVRTSQFGLTGFEADQWLRQKRNIVAELPNLHNLTFMITIGNLDQDISNLVEAFGLLVQQADKSIAIPLPLLPTLAQEPLYISPREAFFCSNETIAYSSAIGRISGDLICPYPPGIPLIMPGERITQAHLEYLTAIVKQGGIITGCQDSSLETLKVLLI